MRALRRWQMAMSTLREFSGAPRHKRIVSLETEIYSPRIDKDIYYRGYPVRELTKHCNFLEVSHLLINGELPSEKTLTTFGYSIHKGAMEVASTVDKTQSNMPKMLHIADLMTFHLSVLNSLRNISDDITFEKVLGECVSIISKWPPGYPASDLEESDPMMDLLSRAVCFKPLKDLDKATRNILNTIAILYMDHGLTSASYAARLCTSEQGSMYSALISAVATHRSCMPMISWNMFDKIFDAPQMEKDEIVAKFLEEKRLSKPFRDFVVASRDPRIDILLEQCANVAVEQVVAMEKGFEGRCHFRFDVYIFSLLRSLYEGQNEDTINAMYNLLLLPRTVGWISHIAEQKNVKRRIEHIAAYVGPSPKTLGPKGSS